MGKIKTNDNLSGMFQSPTAPYNAAAPNYGAMPQQITMPAFMPGQQQAIAQQLSQGYGQPQQSYMDAMNSYYAPVNMTRMTEPLTQSMRAWGLQTNGQPGGVEAMEGGFNPGGFQQYGMGTGSPWLDQMFGLQAGMSAPNTPATPASLNPYDPLTRPHKYANWNQKNPAPTGGIL